MSQQISGNNIPLSEVYWSLVNKADKKFSKIRDLPFYERSRYENYFFKVFKVYTQLWKFQQENRQKLVEAGLKRLEIGEIASRIAQLYYGHYMRTSDAGYLSESYVFYEPILTREYFKEGLFQDLNIANKQLRFLARFLMVCLVLGRREMVHQLVDQFKRLIDECKRTFQETDFKEWKVVAQDIVRFLKSDTAFMNTRPLRYSLVLDPNLDAGTPRASRSLRLTDAILSSYYYNEVKYSELTLDSFRMLQCLEWEPSGSLYQSTGAKMGLNAPVGVSRINSQSMNDPTLPPNPRKAVLYRPSITHFLAVVATICEELPSHGILLLYLSASGKNGQISSSPLSARSATNVEENILRDFESHTITQERDPSLQITPSGQSLRQISEDAVSTPCGLSFGSHGLTDIRPYKTSWRVQVKVLHSWRQYTNLTGETLELVVADAQGMKIHASIKKDLVSKYVNHLPVNEWRFIETFALNHASGQFRPTGHLYKMSFVTGTTVLRCDPVSDSSYLSLATFPNILNGDLNPYMLIDVMGQVVNIGELETLEANNKPTTKLDFELRDENDERLSCTLWGSFAQQVFNACDAADGARVICLIRFAKIKAYKGVRSISNSFDATQVLINPPIPEVAAFLTALPADGLALTFRESVPKFQMVTVAKDDSYLQYERKTISELLSSMEIGKVRVVCTIYGIDTDWAWYYFSCRNCNKKVTHIHSGVNSGSLKKPKPRFWCDVCKNAVTNVVAKYMLYAKVMDNTGETKCLLFDSICADIVGETAATVLGGSFNEIEDPEDLPEVVQNLKGKTFLFLLCVEKENIWDGKDCYKVSRVLSKHGLLGDEAPEDSDQLVNPASIVSGDQPLLLTMSQDTSDSVTPSSKRVYALNISETDQASSSKKVCIQPVDLVKSSPEFRFEVESGKKDDEHGAHSVKDGEIKGEGVKIDDGVSVNGQKVEVKPVEKLMSVKIKREIKKEKK